MKEVTENFINIRKELSEINTELRKKFKLMAPVQKWSFALRAYSLYAATIIFLVHLFYGLGMALAFVLLLCALFVTVSFYISKDIRLYSYMSTEQRERTSFRNSSIFMSAIFLPLAVAFAFSVSAVAVFIALSIGLSFAFSYVLQRRSVILSRTQNLLSVVSKHRVRSTNAETKEEIA